jgi:hypothetical protein
MIYPIDVLLVSSAVIGVYLSLLTLAGYIRERVVKLLAMALVTITLTAIESILLLFHYTKTYSDLDLALFAFPIGLVNIVLLIVFIVASYRVKKNR